MEVSPASVWGCIPEVISCLIGLPCFLEIFGSTSMNSMNQSYEFPWHKFKIQARWLSPLRNPKVWELLQTPFLLFLEFQRLWKPQFVHNHLLRQPQEIHPLSSGIKQICLLFVIEPEIRNSVWRLPLTPDFIFHSAVRVCTSNSRVKKYVHTLTPEFETPAESSRKLLEMRISQLMVLIWTPFDQG